MLGPQCVKSFTNFPGADVLFSGRCNGMARRTAYNFLCKHRDISTIYPNYSDFDRKLTKKCIWIASNKHAFADADLKLSESARAQHGDEVPVYLASVKVCTKNKDLCTGAQVHDALSRRGLVAKCSDALIVMYAQCGILAKAKELFDIHNSRNVFTWNALIAGYARKGQGQDALNLFELMLHEGLIPDAVSFTCALKACGSIGALDKGVRIHEEVDKRGLLGKDIVLGTAIVDMYAKCGALPKAKLTLGELPVRTVISWNALIAGYVQHGEGAHALNCFDGMLREGLIPDVVTFICILKACGSIGAADKGEKIHDEIAKLGLLRNNLPLANALIDMYVKCRILGKAHQVLKGLHTRNVISWSSLIAGFAQHGEGEQAMKCFEQMQGEGLHPNSVTFICLLQACGSIGAADKGEKLHDQISMQGLLGTNHVLGTALVDMYAKCGALAKARQVLEELPYRDAISWNALIAGSVQQGEAEQALDYFEQMQCEGLSPGAATFSCVLSACSRLGLVEDAQMYFVNMQTRYGTEPVLEHYTCMVDLFGRAGHLDKAVEMIEKIPSSDSGVWSALLGACRKWGDVCVGKWAFDYAVQVDKSASAIYVIMADIYAAAGMQEDAETIEALRIQNKAWKRPIQSKLNALCENGMQFPLRQLHMPKAVVTIRA